MNNPSMYGCSECRDERFILNGCCSGRECGCRGQPVSMSTCKECNQDGKKPIGEYVGEWADKVEFID